MAIIIKSIKGFQFALPTGDTRIGFVHGTGLALYDNVTDEWIAGNKKGMVSSEFPFVPAGGRAALKSILADSGEFFKLQPRVKSL